MVGIRPLVWCEEVVIERRCRVRQRMRGGEVDLLSPICLQSCNLVSKLTVT